MARMSNKRRLEWSFFLNDRSRITYNELCRKQNKKKKPPGGGCVPRNVFLKFSKKKNKSPESAKPLKKRGALYI